MCLGRHGWRTQDDVGDEAQDGEGRNETRLRARKKPRQTKRIAASRQEGVTSCLR